MYPDNYSKHNLPVQSAYDSVQSAIRGAGRYDMVDPASTSAGDAFNMSNLLNSYMDFQRSQTKSAYDLQMAMIDKQNLFNAEQAAADRAFQQSSAERAMQFEDEQNRRAMEFSERMSNTQFQRAVSDLRSAGLNPILAYQGLNGSAPTGSAGSGRSAGGSRASSVGADVSSALKVDRSDLLKLVASLLLAKENNAAAMDRTITSGLLSILDIL